MADPRPLPPGTVLAERFVIQHVLGRGGFGIAYRAKDYVRADLVVIKELAPSGLHRASDGMIELGQSGDRLRQSFLNESKLLGKLNVRGLLPVRASFAELGTAYFVTEYLDDARTLDQLIRDEGRMSEEGALDIFYQVLETLEAVHERGVLHRDLKPSNILVNDKGIATLIDFGSAREWHSDAHITHTVQYTPGYAPPEQMSERARRGPATDLYGLCATLYHALVGDPPLSAMERIAGGEYVRLRVHRPDIELAVASAVDKGLSLTYSERPQSVAELRDLLANIETHPQQHPLQLLDEQLVRLSNFSYNRRSCPACSELLVDVKPLRRGICPVCTEGTIRKRDIHERHCPVCRAGVLHPRANAWPTMTCPSCSEGILRARAGGLIAKLGIGSKIPPCECPECHARFEGSHTDLTVVEDPSGRLRRGESGTLNEWLEAAGRSREFRLCDGCGAQFDLQGDGRLRQMHPKTKAAAHSFYPEEWARIASGLPPYAGNAECERCNAEYYLESDRLTLLSATEDPNGFARIYEGRLLSLEAVRWLAVGKESPQAGCVCDSCPTEFDSEGEYLRLVRTKHSRLSRFTGQAKTPEDWRRIALGLPSVADEDAFEASLEFALRDAYRDGTIGFDDANSVLWRGPASREGQNSTFMLTNQEATFGGPFRKWRVPADVIGDCNGSEDCLQIFLSGYKDPIEFMLAPVELTAHLRSGNQTILLTAADLAARVNAREPSH